MEMTIDKCAEMLIVKIECMKRIASGTDIDCNLFNCDKCSLFHEQGTMEEYEEAFKFAVDTMHKYQKMQEIVNSKTTKLSYEEGFKQIKEVIEDGNDNN